MIDPRLAAGTRDTPVVAGGRPAEKLLAEHEMRLVVVEHERAVGKLAHRRIVVAAALTIEPQVDGVGTRVADEPEEARVVGAAAERARPVARCEGGRLVEEEELGELPRLHQRPAVPALELEPAGDPTARRLMPPDPALRVVQAAAVAVDEPARRMGDELAERRHPVLERLT